MEKRLLNYKATEFFAYGDTGRYPITLVEGNLIRKGKAHLLFYDDKKKVRFRKFFTIEVLNFVLEILSFYTDIAKFKTLPSNNFRFCYKPRGSNKFLCIKHDPKLQLVELEMRPNMRVLLSFSEFEQFKNYLFKIKRLVEVDAIEKVF